jgi:small-conductance mechanosensitive channel
MREAADEQPEVLKHPAPEVFLTEFGDSAWNMRLWFWIPQAQMTRRVRSGINIAIVKKFRENGVEIPYPQRDLHLRSPLPLPVGSHGVLEN